MKSPKSADAIVDVTRDIAAQSLNAARAYADDAKALLDKAVDKSAGSMDKVEARVKEDMRHAHAALHKKTEAEKARMHEVGDAIREYAANKVHEMSDATRSALHRSAKTSKAHLQNLVLESKEHSKKLLRHSHAKVNEWLGNMKEKVHHKA